MPHLNSYIELRVPSLFAYRQIAASLLIGGAVGYGIWWTVTGENVEGSPLVKALLVFGGLFFYAIVLLPIVRNWFRASYRLRISDSLLVGTNLFGKERILNIDSIREVKRLKGMTALEFHGDNGQYLVLSPDMDYLGFAYDYILARLGEGVIIDSLFLDQLRDDVEYWAYTRRYPFNTVYEEGALEKLQARVQEQMGEMIEAGILKGGVVYGDERDL